MTIDPTLSDTSDFWSTVDRRGPFECWPDRSGARPWAPSRMRLAYERATGQALPDGKAVYRKCGTFGCLNPRHLGAGDRGDVTAAIDQVKASGPACRVGKVAKPVADRGPEPKPTSACSFCWHSGKPGTAIVCGKPMTCPACSVPGWAALVARFGAESA